MKPQIKVTKALANGNGLIVSPGWITNGHWMLKRSRVTNQALLTSAETVEACGIPVSSSTKRVSDGVAEDSALEDIAILSDASAPYEFTVSEWIKDMGAQPDTAPAYRSVPLRKLTAEDGAVTYLNAKYAAGIGIEVGDVLYSTHKDGLAALRSEDSTLVIMSVRA